MTDRTSIFWTLQLGQELLSCLPSVLSLGVLFFFSSRRRHTRCLSDWSSDVCSSDLLHFAHRFSIYLRAPEQDSTATYADLFWLLVSAKPTGAPSWESLLHLQIDPDCYPMDMDLPSAQRNTVVVSADGATLDYFEVQATLVEQGNPGGE